MLHESSRRSDDTERRKGVKAEIACPFNTSVATPTAGDCSTLIYRRRRARRPPESFASKQTPTKGTGIHGALCSHKNCGGLRKIRQASTSRTGHEALSRFTEDRLELSVLAPLRHANI